MQKRKVKKVIQTLETGDVVHIKWQHTDIEADYVLAPTHTAGQYTGVALDGKTFFTITSFASNELLVTIGELADQIGISKRHVTYKGKLYPEKSPNSIYHLLIKEE